MVHKYHYVKKAEVKENPAHGETAKETFQQSKKMLDPLFFWVEISKLQKFTHKKGGDLHSPKFGEKIISLVVWRDFLGLFLSRDVTKKLHPKHLPCRIFGSSSLNRERETTFPASPILISQFQPSELRIQWTFWDLEAF